jgi:hypothetical protein
MNTQDVFAAEWRACLRAHFFHVIRERDTSNEQSLITVLLETGFADEEIAAMRAEALTELGWTDEPEVDSETELSAQGEAAAPPVETADNSEGHELSVASDDADEDQPPGPPVQLSLF